MGPPLDPTIVQKAPQPLDQVLALTLNIFRVITGLL